ALYYTKKYKICFSSFASRTVRLGPLAREMIDDGQAENTEEVFRYRLGSFEQTMPRVVFLLAFVCIAPASGSMVITLNAGSGLSSNSAALAAFQRAANAWASLFSDSINVRISADLTNLGSSTIIGQTSTASVGVSYSSLRSALISNASGGPVASIEN